MTQEQAGTSAATTECETCRRSDNGCEVVTEPVGGDLVKSYWACETARNPRGADRLWFCFGTRDPVEALDVLCRQPIARYGPSTEFVNVAYLRTLRDGMREMEGSV